MRTGVEDDGIEEAVNGEHCAVGDVIECGTGATGDESWCAWETGAEGELTFIAEEEELDRDDNEETTSDAAFDGEIEAEVVMMTLQDEEWSMSISCTDDSWKLYRDFQKKCLVKV